MLIIPFVCLGLGLVTTPISAGELDLTDEQNSKVSRFKAKARVVRNKEIYNYYPETEDEDTEGSPIEDADCGTVDIGNVSDSRPYSIPKQIDVIITGDVINTGNDCR